MGIKQKIRQKQKEISRSRLIYQGRTQELSEFNKQQRKTRSRLYLFSFVECQPYILIQQFFTNIKEYFNDVLSNDKRYYNKFIAMINGDLPPVPAIDKLVCLWFRPVFWYNIFNIFSGTRSLTADVQAQIKYTQMDYVAHKPLPCVFSRRRKYHY